MRCVFGKSRIYVKIVIKQNLGNIHKSKAAETLEIGRKTLIRKLAEYSLVDPAEE